MLSIVRDTTIDLSLIYCKFDSYISAKIGTYLLHRGQIKRFIYSTLQRSDQAIYLLYFTGAKSSGLSTLLHRDQIKRFYLLYSTEAKSSDLSILLHRDQIKRFIYSTPQGPNQGVYLLYSTGAKSKRFIYSTVQKSNQESREKFYQRVPRVLAKTINTHTQLPKPPSPPPEFLPYISSYLCPPPCFPWPARNPPPCPNGRGREGGREGLRLHRTILLDVLFFTALGAILEASSMTMWFDFCFFFDEWVCGGGGRKKKYSNQVWAREKWKFGVMIDNLYSRYVSAG